MSDFKIVKLVDPITLQFNGPKFTGAYDNSTSYLVGDSVSYLGSSYVATVPTTANLPTDTAFWQVLVEGFSGNHSDLNLDDGTNPHGTTATDVGLGNVDNTSDASKPVSTAQQAALDLKYDASNPNNYIDAAGAPVQTSDIADFETTTELNDRDTANRDRANHTGAQLSTTISDFDTAVSSNTAVAANTVKVSADGSVTTHNDVTDAGSGSIITVAERNKLAGVEAGAAADQNASEVPVTPLGNLAATDVQAALTELQGDVDSINAAAVTNHSQLVLDDGTNPHGTTAADVGLGNVDNTSDLDKPISTATQSALDLKADILDPKQESYFFDDFFVGTNEGLGWNVVNIGAGSSANQGFYGLNNPAILAIGIQDFRTGSTNSGVASLARSIGSVALGVGFSFEQTWRAATQILSTPTEQFVTYIGLIDSQTITASVDGIYFVYSDSLGPNYLCITRNANVQTVTDSGVAANTTYNTYKITVNDTATEANFFINDVLVATHSTNIPGGPGRGTGIGATIAKITGTTSRSLFIDYYEHKFTIPGGRP